MLIADVVKVRLGRVRKMGTVLESIELGGLWVRMSIRDVRVLTVSRVDGAWPRQNPGVRRLLSAYLDRASSWRRPG